MSGVNFTIMFKLAVFLLFVTTVTNISALSSFGPGIKKQAVYTYAAPAQSERFFVPVPNSQSNAQVQGVNIRSASPLQSAPAQNYVSAQQAQPYVAAPAPQHQLPPYISNAVPQQNPAAVGGSAVSVPQQYQYAIKQLPYYPPQQQYFPNQQVIYPASTGPQNFLFAPPLRYPGSNDGTEQPPNGGWFNWWPSNFQWPQGGNWGNFPAGNFPVGNFPFGSGGSAPGTQPAGAGGSTDSVVTSSSGSEGTSPEANQAVAVGNRIKPEKVEAVDIPQVPQEAPKSVTNYPNQQFFVVPQGPYVNQAAAVQGEKDPVQLSSAAKGAISSFLLAQQPYPSQLQSEQGLSQQLIPQQLVPQQLIPQSAGQQQYLQQQLGAQPYAQQGIAQQIVPQQLAGQPQFVGQQQIPQQQYVQQVIPQQKTVEIPSVQDSASLAYQRFLLQSKQRSEQPSLKNGLNSEDAASQSSETPIPNIVSNAGAAAESTSPDSAYPYSQSSAEAAPNAIAYAGKGGVAGAAPGGTAVAGTRGKALSAPRATAIAGTSDDDPEFAIVPVGRQASQKNRNQISVARYTPQRGYHITGNRFS